MPDSDDDPLPEVEADSVPVEIAKDALVAEFERPHGILTSTDRKYLSGFKQYQHRQSEANKRRDIRKRVVHAFHDFRLFNWLSDGERKKIFEAIDAGKLHEDLVSLLAFVYRGLDRDVEALEQIVEAAVFRVEAEDQSRDLYWGGITEVSVDIDRQYGYDAEDLHDRLQQGQGDELTPAEIGVMVRAGLLDEEDCAQLAVNPNDSDEHSASIGRTPWYWPLDDEEE